MHVSLFSANKSLTSKLVIAVSIFIILGSFLFWFSFFSKEQKHLLEDSINFVASSSEVVKQSLRYDMLAANMQDIQPTLESIGTSDIVEGVKIFGTKGRVFYSSDKDEVGKSLGKENIVCKDCHFYSTTDKEQRLVEVKRWIIQQREEYRTLTYVDPIYNEPDCSTAVCHAHPEDKKVLGLLMTDFSLKGIDARMRQQKIATTVYLISFVVLIGSALSYILWILVLKPLTSLSDGMVTVSSGDLSHKVPVTTEDELGRLAETFNSMTDELNTSRGKMEKWTQNLEEEVDKKTEQIKKAQGKLIQAEKLAALGRLTADIAHQIRNPLAALGGFGRRLQKLASTEKQETYADIIVNEAERLERILRDVLTFSWDAKYRLERMPVSDVVRDAILVSKEICDDHGITIELKINTQLSVLIDPAQLREALNNIIANAIDAMPDGGILSLVIDEEEYNFLKYVVIHVSDTGPGIPESELSRIYEPFFTTKKIGQGTGLGLAICRKIIEEHGGFIKAGNLSEGGFRVSLYLIYQAPEDIDTEPCWEFMKCGRNINSEQRCPAYPYFGRACWAVAGTLCEGKVQGTFAQKLNDCHKCDFYKEATTVKN